MARCLTMSILGQQTVLGRTLYNSVDRRHRNLYSRGSGYTATPANLAVLDTTVSQECYLAGGLEHFSFFHIWE